jgi:hypothetical protein
VLACPTPSRKRSTTNSAPEPAIGRAVLIHGRLRWLHRLPPAVSWHATVSTEDGSARSVVEVVRDHLEEIRDETGYSVPAGVADEIASPVERLR